jgi:hypothetical protein
MFCEIIVTLRLTLFIILLWFFKANVIYRYHALISGIYFNFLPFADRDTSFAGNILLTLAETICFCNIFFDRNPGRNIFSGVDTLLWPRRSFPKEKFPSAIKLLIGHEKPTLTELAETLFLWQRHSFLAETLYETPFSV